MGNKVVTEYEIKFTGNPSEIAEQGIAALRKLDQEARSAGTTTGVGPQITQLSKRVAQAQVQAGASPSQLLRTEKAFRDHVEGMRKVLRFQGGVVDFARVVDQYANRRPRETAQSGTKTDFKDLPVSVKKLQEFVKAETAERRRNAAGAAALARSPKYLAGETEAVTRNAGLSAKKATALINPSSTEAFVQEAQEAALLRGSIAEAKAASEDYATAMALDATAAKQEAAALNRAKAASNDYLEALANEQISTKGLANAEQAELLKHVEYAAVIRDSIETQKRRQRIEAEATGSKANVENDARTQVAKKRAQLNTEAEVARLLNNPGDRETTVQSRLSAARSKLAEDLAVQSTRTQEDIQAEARLILLKREQARQLAQSVDQLSGKGNASLFQRLMFSAKNGGGFGGGGSGGVLTAADEPSFGKFLTNHAIRTAGYALPGIAIGLGFAEIAKAVQESEQAQRSFALLAAQFQNLGQSSQLAGFTNQIVHLSDATGVAVNEVTQLALVMKGVYGDTGQAEAALKNVTQAAIAFNLTANEAGRDTAALTQNFRELSTKGADVATKQVTNAAAYAQTQFGVPAGQLLSGAADLSPVAAQLGLTSQQTFGLVAGTAQRSGIPVDEVAQNLSRILPQFQSNLPDLERYYQAIPALQPNSAKFLGDVSSGDSGAAFLQFIQDFKNIPQGIQASIAETLGDTRYAPQLIAASQNGQSIAAFGSVAIPGNAADNAFKAAGKTLQVQLDQVRNDFVNAGVGILNSGIGTTLEHVAQVVGGLAKGFEELNRATGGGFGDTIAAVAGTFIALKTAMAGVKALKEVGSWLSTVGQRSQKTTVNLEDQAAANEGVSRTASTATDTLSQETLANDALGVSAQTTAGKLTGEAVINSGGGGIPVGGAVRSGVTRGGPFGLSAGGRINNLGMASETSSLADGSGALGTGLSAGGLVAGSVLVPLAFYESFKDTTHLLNSHKKGSEEIIARVLNSVPNFVPLLGGHKFFAKSDVGNGPAAALTDNVVELQKNFARTHQAQLQALYGIASAAQRKRIDHDLGRKGGFLNYASALDNQAEGGDLLQLYNQLSSTKQGSALLADQKSADADNPAFNNARTAGILQDQQNRKAALAAAHLKTQQAAAEALQVGAHNALNTYQDMQSYYEAGQVSFGKYIGALDRQIAGLKALAKPTADQIHEAAQLEATKAQALDQKAQQEQQAASTVLQPGLVSTDVSNLKNLAALVSKSSSPGNKIGAGLQYVQQIYTSMQDAASAAQNGAQKIAATTQTVTLDPTVIAALNSAGIKLPAQITGTLNAVQKFQYLNEDIQAAGALAQAGAHEDPLKQAHAALTTAQNQMAAALKAGEGKDSSDYKTAQAAATAASQQVTDANNSVIQAQDSLSKAYDTSAGDGVAAALDAQQQARDAYAAAHGKAEQLQALAQEVQADEQYVQATNELATAQAGLLTAIAQASGDPRQIIAAAQNAAATELSNAERIRAADAAVAAKNGKSYNANSDSKFVAAMQKYYNDRATASNTIAQQTISSNETLLFLGKETATAAIANLEAALPKVKGDIAATNQILTEIRQIQNSAGQNLNFDLPTTIFGSSLYQARRLESGVSAIPKIQGGPVSVVIHVNGGSATSVKSAVNKLTAAVAGPQRTGTLGPLLNG